MSGGRNCSLSAAPDAAAERIDPSFASAATAISDLQRRVGWLREIEHRTEGEMREHLSALDEGMDHLVALSRRAGLLPRRTTRGRVDPGGLSNEPGSSNWTRLPGASSADRSEPCPGPIRMASGPAPL